ncbi:velvet factor-domain-containing protein [Annulohypoxylon maeteangense]|uniref:velvet factor-domain-containing protein n=1 Tax=Annulohypoxylon maeteangense TaxID=1927788 RepID=UPI002008E55B|nr:velvet factor-domain-containing protein [Annulohypoxylon maeteangense]KAI0887754.1 velvet factor-domain-containing protein [Annulohypoxylon maeteangense]
MAFHTHHSTQWVSHGPPTGYMPAMSPAMPPLSGPPQVHHQQHPQQSGPQPQRPESYRLEVLQQPTMAKAANGKDKDRKPVDPPPILQLHVPSDEDPDGVYRQSPYLIAVAYLEYAHPPGPNGQSTPPANMMAGTTVSSLHRLKDPTNKEGAFFVFGDLTIKSEGEYVIRFDLLQMTMDNIEDGEFWVTICSVTSDPFKVHAGRAFPGMAESTFLTRSFSDQGVRLRLRKDSRQIANKKKNMRMADMDKQTGHRQGGAPQNGGMQPIDERSYHDYAEEPVAKRHRAEYSTINPGTPTQEGGPEMRWGPYGGPAGPGYTSQQLALGSVTTGPPSSATTVSMPPPTGRIETHFSSLQGPHAYERQSPLNHSPIQFGNPNAPNSSHPFIFTGGSNAGNNPPLNLAPIPTHPQSAMASPIHNVSPRSHGPLNGAPPSGTASPVGPNLYTTAPPTSNTHQTHHSPYSNQGAYQGMTNAYDHGSLREHGLGTPLTATMPSESLNGSYPISGADSFDHHLGHMVNKTQQDH